MKKYLIILLALAMAAAASCGKADENEPQVPEVSDEPQVSEDPQESKDPEVPLETLELSLPTIDYTKDGDDIWRARVTYTIVTQTDEVYFVWGKDAKLSSSEIIAKYKPSRMDDNGNGGWEYTIPELLPLFQVIDIQAVAVKGETIISKTTILHTYKSDAHESTLYIEADECAGYAYKDGFTITMVKDADLYNNGTGGYKITATVSAPGNWDGNKKVYTIPDGNYTLGDEESRAKFSAYVPGIGEFTAEGTTAMGITSNNMLGTWEVFFSFDAEYDDWNQFKKVKNVVFTFTDKAMDIKQETAEHGAFPMKGSVDFQPDQNSSKASIVKRWFNFNYKALLWSATDTSSDSKYVDLIYVPLVIPSDFTPGVDSWSKLDGTYSLPAEGSTYYSPFNAAAVFLNIFQQADASGVSYARYDKTKWEIIDPESSAADLLLAMLDATVQSAFPANGATVAKLSASKDGAWLQLEVDFKDNYSDYHVRCTTIIMTEDIKTAE